MKKPSSVPTGRLRRLASLGGLTLNLAGNVAKHGLKELAQAKRPDLKSLLLTPRNAATLADKLAHMRGAAMKVGQLISMDAGELMPKELANILSVLQQQATYMPAHQVASQLRRALGPDWQRQFQSFEMRPFAAASIGQVHHAYAKNGQKLAVKIQYPGIANAIGSDVDNIATLLNLLDLHPPAMDMQAILDVAKAQLNDEADYQKEADYLKRYKAKLIDTPSYRIPDVIDDLSSSQILTMSFEAGKALTELNGLPQHQRDQIFTDLLTLFLREVFEFHMLQSDPNMANYRYQVEEKKLVLLDFGATRCIEPSLSKQYQKIIVSELNGDREASFNALKNMGFIHPSATPAALNVITGLLNIIKEPLADQPFDFANTQLLSRANQLALSLNQHQEAFGNPPPEAMFIHRKALGLLFIAKRLKANVNVRESIRSTLKI